jgi:alkylation response protein AidB-like acyl-CoA dehydrogenase
MPNTYTPPLRDQQFVMHELLKVSDAYANMPTFSEVDADTINQVLDAAGTFCAEVLQPINALGDAQGCVLNPHTHEVKTPDGFKEAYAQFVEGGWGSLTADPAHGGQGLPRLLEIAFFEMQYASNQAWAMYPGLAHGAYTALAAHATESQKQRFLPKLVSGEWMGTMCLTEPHCGTDLGLIKTRAVPNPEGTSYTLTGNKIFISAGEHDLSSNIIHLVLAKLPDAPEGSKGISLFIVPKFQVDTQGDLIKNISGVAERNPIYCTGLEHKMGINGNATCQLALEGATGYLVSEPNKGLQAMFVMMNGARLGVGMQGLGITEAAYQKAVAYAKDRVQGRSLSGVKAKDKPADPIIVHADVRRSLMTARAYAEGGRAFGYWVALLIDQSQNHIDEKVRKESELLLGLMTPIVKAFMTDNGFQCASDCLGVLGGHGYLRDWGMEQLVRDARINMIYEGTNAIQSLDLLGRKVLKDQGAALGLFGKQVEAFLSDAATDFEMMDFTMPLMELGQKLPKLTTNIGVKAMANADEIGAASVDYLRVVGHLVYGYLWARMAKVALNKIALAKQNNVAPDAFYVAKLHTARFYFQKLLPEVDSCMARIKNGAGSVMAMDADLF